MFGQPQDKPPYIAILQYNYSFDFAFAVTAQQWLENIVDFNYHSAQSIILLMSAKML